MWVLYDTCKSWLYFAGHRSRTRTICPRHLVVETLEIRQGRLKAACLLEVMVGWRSPLLVVVRPGARFVVVRCCWYDVWTQHATPPDPYPRPSLSYTIGQTPYAYLTTARTTWGRAIDSSTSSRPKCVGRKKKLRASACAPARRSACCVQHIKFSEECLLSGYAVHLNHRRRNRRARLISTQEGNNSLSLIDDWL